jgi:glycosyltransferase involved in cell wall biosynthesis
MNCRILYVVGQLRDGGLERQLYYLLETMDRERYEPVVLVWNFLECDKYVSKIRALRVPLYGFHRGSSRTGKMTGMRSLVQCLHPQVLHSYSFYTNFAAWYAACATNVVATGSVRTDFDRAKREAGLLLGRLSARWPRSQIFNSFAAAESARRSHTAFVPRQLFVIRNALDLDTFVSKPLEHGARPKMVAIGSFTAVKRWDLLLQAASRLKRNGSEFLLELVGDGPLRHSLQKQAQELMINDRVTFMRRSDNVPDLLCHADFLVHTSDSEGCPNVVMEAMACGRPVVATDAGDIPSLVSDGKTGFVVHRGDIDALAHRIRLLLNSRDLAKRMGNAGRAAAEREFGLNRLVEQTFSAYRAAGWKDQ